MYYSGTYGQGYNQQRSEHYSGPPGNRGNQNCVFPRNTQGIKMPVELREELEGGGMPSQQKRKNIGTGIYDLSKQNC